MIPICFQYALQGIEAGLVSAVFQQDVLARQSQWHTAVWPTVADLPIADVVPLSSQLRLVPPPTEAADHKVF